MIRTIIDTDHPQKRCLKMICDVMYYIGLGDYWYETRLSKYKHLYPFWWIFANCYFLFGLINEFGANFRTLVSEKERNDLIQFNFAHTSIGAQLLVLYLQRKRIPIVLKDLVESERIVNLEVEKAAVNKAFKCCALLLVTLYCTLLAATIDAIRLHIQTGTPISTEVVYYPTRVDSGVLVNILRFMIEFHWWLSVTMMAAIDCLAFCALVFVEYKFRVLQLYFGELKAKYVINVGKKSSAQLIFEFKKCLIVGMKFHENALWCASSVQYSLGNLYSVQIFQSIALVVLCLIKLVVTEHYLIYIVANMVYLACVLILTAIYMKAGGDITYEASMISDSIFYSGWEVMAADRELRCLCVVAIQRSNVPVIMSAFRVIPLSYSNFISVLRYSYSFFAVMY